MATFAERLSVAEKINARIGALLASRYADERRLVLMLAYLNLSLSHHLGIICMMVNRLCGLALALVRLTLEAMIRAHWIAKCASDAQVADVAERDNAKLPKITKWPKQSITPFPIRTTRRSVFSNRQSETPGKLPTPICIPVSANWRDNLSAIASRPRIPRKI
jgi:hypothetical protein